MDKDKLWINVVAIIMFLSFSFIILEVQVGMQQPLIMLGH